ncbi:hypothetical protein [Bradyrhizobium elkanii]|uniref:Uncharacterized protein n=1 Tax=Bradyrhizobium elkanii TaxID=29448 RepID=A0A8I1YEX8_BRAEL|nr:hypothetical protein [Bradyrhizobium elkanii]MBP1297480.1 hypothetical protein [Bradyrhizobium elkanii]
MPIYLVRTIKNHDLVGVFAAPSVLDLALLLDEALDPGGCEYQRLPPGGIMWEQRAITIPIEQSEEDEEKDAEDVPWSEARFTEDWETALYGMGKAARWTKIDVALEDMYGANPEAPEPEPSPKPLTKERAGELLFYRKPEAK